MSAKDNKALARHVFEEVWSKGRLDLVDEMLTPDFVGRPGGMGEPFHGPEGAKEFISRLRAAFPDVSYTIEHMVADGDLVSTRWTMRGTHEGAFMGLEPTGRQVTVEGITFQRFDGGRIAEGWTQMDAVGLLRQVGALPEPARA